MKRECSGEYSSSRLIREMTTIKNEGRNPDVIVDCYDDIFEDYLGVSRQVWLCIKYKKAGMSFKEIGALIGMNGPVSASRARAVFQKAQRILRRSRKLGRDIGIYESLIEDDSEMDSDHQPPKEEL